MKLFLRSLIVFLFLIFSLTVLPQTAFAQTSPFRSADIVTTDISGTFYTNLNNCSVTDGLTCDRATATSFGNLYFKDFGNYEDFGIPEGSTITKVRIKVTGKATVPVFGLFVDLSSNCQTPSDLWKLFQLNGNAINTQTFVTNVTQSGVPSAVKASCLSPITFENKSFVFRINYSSNLPWSANIDNFEVAFDYNRPIITPTPTPVKTPLILIPGIGGSELKIAETSFGSIFWSQEDGHGGTFTNVYPEGEKVWVNNLEASKPGNDDYFDILRLQTDGQTSEANLELTGNLFEDYQKTIDFFVSEGYVLNNNFFVFPYDWRKDISLTAILLDEKIESIKSQTGSTKVDIVAHSMGGLVARNYIADSSKTQNVRKLFTIGTPHLGSVKFMSAIKYGLCLKFEIGSTCLSMAPSEVKDVLQNMISGYELAPSETYFDFYSGEDNNHPYPFADVRDIDENEVTGVLNYSQIKTLLTNLGHNTNLFNPSEVFHNLDNNLNNTNGVEVINIAGSGMPTLGQIIERYSIDFLGVKIPKKDEVNINGDRTVPLFSASLIDSSRSKSLLGDAKVFYTKQEHGALVASGPALNLVKNILENDSQLPNGVSIQPYPFSGTQVSVHSPVNIHVYANGNHTGPKHDGDFEENIPGSSYDTLDDAKFIWLPDDGIYTIKFEATDQGSFDFKIRKYENNENTQTVLYNNIPLSENTKAETIFDTLGEPPILLVDEDGNGDFDFNVEHFSILKGDANYDRTSPTISFNVNPKYIWPPNNKMVDVNITGNITDENPYLITILVDDEYDLTEPSITIQNQTDINQIIRLEALRRLDDKDGRIYKIKILATDLAGNTSLSTAEVIVPHDERK